MKGRTVLSSGRYPLYQRLQYQHFDINTRLNVRQRTHDRASLHKAIRPITPIPPKYFRFSREEKFISSEERKISSEESNETSEESNDKSEEFAISSGGNQKHPPRYLKIHQEGLR